jgi:dephospho-CoA kinase
VKPLVIGLTGSIGMGKSTAARMLREMGVPVFDADATVHRLLARGGAAVRPIEAEFPGTVRDGAVDRQELGRRVFGNDEGRRRLERIVHPLVGRAERQFLARAARERRPVVVRDVPLLFETGGHKRCDATVVVTAPPHVQAQRVMARHGMTPEKFAAILRVQMPDARKRQRADFVVPTGRGRQVTREALAAILHRLRTEGAPRRRRS